MTLLLTVLFPRFFYVSDYLSKPGMIEPVPESTVKMLKLAGDGVLALALILGAAIVLTSLFSGMRAYRQRHETLADKDGIED